MSEWSDLSKVAGHTVVADPGGTELLPSALSLGAVMERKVSLPLEADGMLSPHVSSAALGEGWPGAPLYRWEHAMPSAWPQKVVSDSGSGPQGLHFLSLHFPCFSWWVGQ